MFENLQTLHLDFDDYCAEEDLRDDDDGEPADETMSTSRLLQLAELGISEVHLNPICYLEVHGLLALPDAVKFMDGLS